MVKNFILKIRFPEGFSVKGVLTKNMADFFLFSGN